MDPRRAQVMVVRLPGLGRLIKRALDLRPVHMGGQNRDDGAGYLVLNRKHVLNLAIVALGPAMSTSQSIDELHRDANTLAHSAHAALQEVAHSNVAARLA